MRIKVKHEDGTVATYDVVEIVIHDEVLVWVDENSAMVISEPGQPGVPG